jgi:hypothetical protein
MYIIPILLIQVQKKNEIVQLIHYNSFSHFGLFKYYTNDIKQKIVRLLQTYHPIIFCTTRPLPKVKWKNVFEKNITLNLPFAVV